VLETWNLSCSCITRLDFLAKAIFSSPAVFRREALIQISVNFMLITALHGMQTRSSDEKVVRPSVCLSVKRVDCDKTEERSVQIFIPCKRSFSLVF